MNLYGYQEAFGCWDKTTPAMRTAIEEWFRLYYDRKATDTSDPCLRIAYTVVNKLTKAVFGEYAAWAEAPFTQRVLQQLDACRREALALTLVGGESYLKPVPHGNGFRFGIIPRNRLLIFGRDANGMATDVGLAEQSVSGDHYFTLLERRYLDARGLLTLENRLYRARLRGQLGEPVALSSHPAYASLAAKYTFPVPLGGIGLIRLRTPMVNCVDGSADGVSVYAPAVGLIRNIDRNEAQLCGEFDRGESRIITSADLLSRDKQLSEHLFVGLDDDPERVGLTVFSPQLREQSFLARKQEYLRNVESVIGLRRGLLADANVMERTATEISSSQGEYNLTVLDFQQVWQAALTEAVQLCARLGELYAMEGACEGSVSVDWGNGVLYDEEKTWADYVQLVQLGLLRPEIALGWRFGMAADTEQQRSRIREKYMPEKLKTENSK